MIRKSTHSDIQSIIFLGLEALKKSGYDELTINKNKIALLARTCVTAPCNFSWVSEQDGVVRGALCAQVHDCGVFEKKQASVVMWYCLIPGDGIRLVREFLRWSRDRPAIKVISFSLEENCDPRIGKILSRLGLNKFIPTYIEMR